MNIHDIAREAGVSIATVSRVLNNSNKVQEETRKTVQAVIDRFRYTPNDLARGLLKNRTSSVGVLTVDILNPYYATVIHEIERNLSARGLHLFLCNTGGSRPEIIRYTRALLEKRADALVFVGSVYKEKDGDAHIRQAAEKVPVFMINTLIEAENIHCILCDDRAGIRDAVNYLLQGRKRRILFINTPETTSARIKEEAFLETLRTEQGSDCEAKIIKSEISRLGGLPGLIEDCYREDFYDAVLATDDLFANVAVNTLHKLRAEVPKSVWVLGYNNSYVCDQTYPRLSSVDSRMAGLGFECADRIDKLLRGDELSGRITYLRPRLVLKDTSG